MSLVISKNDTRSYKTINLSNGIMALLIHDPETDKVIFLFKE